MKRIFNYISVILIGLAATSCNENAKDAIVTPHSEKVLTLPSGDVLYNGSEFVFENNDVFIEYLGKIGSDQKLKASIEAKYADVLLSGQLSNRDFDKAYLFSTLSSSDYAAVNKNGRMTIGNYAIRFDSAYQYFASVNEANLLNFKNEQAINSKVVKEKYGLVPLDKSNLRFNNLNGNGGKTNQQSPTFYYQSPDPYAGQPTKYVNEVIVYIPEQTEPVFRQLEPVIPGT